MISLKKLLAVVALVLSPALRSRARALAVASKSMPRGRASNDLMLTAQLEYLREGN